MPVNEKEKFAEYIKTFELKKEEVRLEPPYEDQTFVQEVMRGIDDYWFDPNHPFNDYKLEVLGPDISQDYPKGCIGIRGDDDFWVLAVFPIEFANVPITDMVQILWPDKFETAEFHINEDEL